MKQSLFSIKCFSRIFGFLVLASFMTGKFQVAQAQWSIVTPNLTQITHSTGALCYHDGIVWLVTSSLFMSTDTGKTWTSKSLPVPTDYANDIEFITPTDGVLTTLDFGTWVTTNAGSTWHQVTYTEGFSACFLNNASQIATTGSSAILGGVSQDSGLTWNNNMPYQGFGMCVRYKSGTIYEFGGEQSGSFIISSSNMGASWQTGSTGIDCDSWSFAVDSCDPNRIYLSHEDAFIPTDNFSKILLTTDRGNTWQTIVEHLEPFFCGSVAEGYTAIYCQALFDGVWRSRDRGMTWSSIGGPSTPYDTRLIAAINDNIVLAIDESGNVWRTDNSGGDSVIAPQSSSANNILFVPLQSSILNQSVCNTQVDTSISLGIVGCGTLTGMIDSLWLTGSTDFQIVDSRSTPRTLGIVDSILVNYSGTLGADTSILHLQYNLGTGIKDTTIQLIGAVSSAFAAHSAQLHREAASAYDGQIDSLPLGVDLSSQINLDSLWPYITDISFTYTWDSSVITFDGFIPPLGWEISSINHGGNSANIDIQNNSSSVTQPLNLGTALFRPRSTQLSTSWVELPSLVINVGSQSLSLCVTDNEDNHWAVKTLGEFSGVTEVPAAAQEISIYPNPAIDAIQVSCITPTSSEISYQVIDAVGRTRLSGMTEDHALSLDVSTLPQGVYFFRATNGDGFSASRKFAVIR